MLHRQSVSVCAVCMSMKRIVMTTHTHTQSTWLYLHLPSQWACFVVSVIQTNFPDLALPVMGCWKYCSLMRVCELWCALTAWPIRLTASLRPDFRPVEGELSTAPLSHFLSCWELEICHEDWPQRRADPWQSGSTEPLFAGEKILDSSVCERICKC